MAALHSQPLQAAPFSRLCLLQLLLIVTCCSPLHLQIAAHSHSSSLRVGFYRRFCPNAESIVRTVVQQAVAKEARMAGSLLRLHFHDCFVQGCDASLLLKSINGVQGEQEARPNNNSVRGFDVVDQIKAALEKQCPGIVSCADILALAARDSVVLSGGPSYGVLLGRRDGLSANRALANQALPGFNFNVSDLVANFAAVGLTTRDMVALSGGHTIGKANCATFSSRLTSSPSDPTIDSSYRASLLQLCPTTNSNNFANLDVGTPTVFDNRYYANLVKGKGLLHSDEVLYSTAGSTREQVLGYANDQASFFRDFVAAMVKMGNISPLTGTQGQIRQQCGVVNSVVAVA